MHQQKRFKPRKRRTPAKRTEQEEYPLQETTRPIPNPEAQKRQDGNASSDSSAATITPATYAAQATQGTQAAQITQTTQTSRTAQTNQGTQATQQEQPQLQSQTEASIQESIAEAMATSLTSNLSNETPMPSESPTPGAKADLRLRPKPAIPLDFTPPVPASPASVREAQQREKDKRREELARRLDRLGRDDQYEFVDRKG